MSEPITDVRLAQLRVAAEVGVRLSAYVGQTVHVAPAELASLVEEVHILRGQQVIDRKEIARLDIANAQLRQEREAIRAELEQLKAKRAAWEATSGAV